MKEIIITYLFLFLVVFGFAQPVNKVKAAGNVYYVSTSGNDGNSCATAQNISSPKRTINGGRSCLQSGDMLMIRGGTYSESLGDNIPSGTSSAHTIIQAYQGESVVLKSTGSRVLYLDNSGYIDFINIIFDGGSVNAVKITSDPGVPGRYAHHITFKGGEMRNAGAKGILIQGNKVPGSAFFVLDGVRVHHNGVDTNLDHGIYIAETSDVLLKNVEADHNAAYGIQSQYPDTNRIIWDGVNSHHNTHGAVFSSESYGSAVYNSRFWANSGRGLQFQVSGYIGNPNIFKVYNNVIYGNGTGWHRWADSRDYGGENPITLLRNNIITNNGTDFVDPTNGNNLTSDHNMIGGDAKFVDPANGNFRLQAGSSAINAGVALTEVSKDADGVSRPSGSAYDIGAYEYGGIVSPTPSPTPTPVPTLKGDLNNDHIVNSLDWSIMNSKWFTSDSIADLNSDGIVNSLDFSIMNGNWLKSG